MNIIHDSELLRQYIENNGIQNCFERNDINFLLLRFDAGELITDANNPMRYFMFLVKGCVSIFALREDGSKYPVENMKRGFLGDREFCGKPVAITAEAKSESFFVAIRLEECRLKLWDDNRFLRLIIMNFSEKLTGYVDLEATQLTFEDRLIYYIENECPGKRLTGINDAIYRIRCSRRQLQRILKKLTAEGRLIKEGRGIYRMPD